MDLGPPPPAPPPPPSPPPPLLKKKRPWYLKTWVLVAAGIFVLLVVVVSLSSPSKSTHKSPGVQTTQATTTPTTKPSATPKPTAKPTATPKATATPKPKATPTPQATIVANYEGSCTAVAISQLVNSPSTYDGTSVTFQATIVNFLQDSSGNTTAMNVSDPNDITSVLYVQLSLYADVTQMNKGDTITIWGDAAGTISAKNAYGGTINESAAVEVYLTDTTTGYADTLDPNPS